MSEVAAMENTQQHSENDTEYQQLANELINQHGPAVKQTVEIDDWPDEVTNRRLVVRDRNSGEPVADVSFGVSPDGQAHLIMPADYTRPMDKYPLVSIDFPETLSPAGELIYEIFEVIDWTIVSPYAEVTEIRKVGALVEQLHHDHDYSPETIETRLIQEAQNRGDLPDTTE